MEGSRFTEEKDEIPQKHSSEGNEDDSAMTHGDDEIQLPENVDRKIVIPLLKRKRELEAQKLVVQFELKNHEDIIQTAKRECEELKNEAAIGYERWLMMRADNLNEIVSIGEEELIEEEIEELQSQFEVKQHERDVNLERIKGSLLRENKIKRVQAFKQEELECLKKEEISCKDHTDFLTYRYGKDLDELKEKRLKSEEITSRNRASLIELRDQINLVRQEIDETKTKIENCKANAEMEVQNLAKLLLK